VGFAAGLQLAGFVLDVGSKIGSAFTSATGHKRRMLIELRDNIELVNLWRQSDFPIDKVILKLERKQYDAAVADNFSLNKLQSRKLKVTTTKGIPQFQKYVGWSTEALIDNVYRKIKTLNNIVDMEPANSIIKKKTRLSNTYKMMILLVHHIDS
jgi:hypothetical protein